MLGPLPAESAAEESAPRPRDAHAMPRRCNGGALPAPRPPQAPRARPRPPRGAARPLQLVLPMLLVSHLLIFSQAAFATAAASAGIVTGDRSAILSANSSSGAASAPEESIKYRSVPIASRQKVHVACYGNAQLQNRSLGFRAQALFASFAE